MASRVVAVIAAVASAAAVATLVGRHRFRSLVDHDVSALFAGELPRVGPGQLEARVNTLPAPVRRYLHYAIRSGTPSVATARLQHGGVFRTAPDQSWWPIAGEQYFTVGRPGFVWRATVKPIPIAWIEARDRLLDGRGNMLVRAFSTATVADARGAEIDQGSRLRWLAECAWFPYAYVGDDVEWTAIDDQSARMTLRGQELPVTAIVHVDEEGRLTRLRAERYRDTGGGKAVLTSWTGTYAKYGEFGGFRVPTSVDVAWELESGPFSYARFEVTTIQYDVRERF
jgi:hypothetical protein